jgi:predicted enzyme related to lactoylglutathione lyase
MVTGIAFTGYSVSDLGLSRQFYEDALGLKPSVVAGPADKGVVEYDVGAGTLSITNRLPFLKAAGGGGVAVLEVSDVAAYTAALKERGVQLFVPLSESPSCNFAMIRDPDGNMIGLHQRKK